MNAQIGSIIKAARKKNKLTLNQLAEKTGISISYLSLMERGLNSPTIENLNKVCVVLNLTMTDLISRVEKSSTTVVRAKERTPLFNEDGYLYEVVFDNTRELNCIVMTIRDNNVHESNSHMYDEIGYIISGSLEMTVKGVKYEIFAGDSIYVEANSNHSYYRTSEEPCVSIWFNIASIDNEI